MRQDLSTSDCPAHCTSAVPAIENLLEGMTDGVNWWSVLGCTGWVEAGKGPAHWGQEGLLEEGWTWVPEVPLPFALARLQK